MGKKASRRRVRDDYQDHSKVRALFSKGNGKLGGWTSLDKDFSERGYTKNIMGDGRDERFRNEEVDQNKQSWL